MFLKRWSTLPRFKEPEVHLQMQFSAIPRTFLFLEALAFCRRYLRIQKASDRAIPSISFSLPPLSLSHIYIYIYINILFVYLIYIYIYVYVVCLIDRYERLRTSKIRHKVNFKIYWYIDWYEQNGMDVYIYIYIYIERERERGCLLACFLAWFYGVATLLGSFYADLDFKQFSLI